jgi:tetratricopeptide (TPR) repeat protein
MILLRSGFGIAALAAGIVAGFILYRAPWQITRDNTQAYDATFHGHFDQAISIFSEQIRRYPDDYIFYLRRGLTQKQQGRLQAAVSDFDNALRLMPPTLTAEALGSRLFNSTLPETHTFAMAMELHSERAEALQQLGRADEALSDLDTAITLNPRAVAVAYQRGQLRLLVGRIDEARADFDAILSRGMNIDALFQRGLTAYLKGAWSSASDDFAKALALRPKSGTFALWLLKAQLRAHQPVPLDEFKALAPANPAWAWINAFLADYDGSELARNLQSTAGADPAKICAATHLLGEWLLIKNGPDQGAAAFRAALQSCPPLSVPHVAAAAELQRLENPAPAFRPAAVRN